MMLSIERLEARIAPAGLVKVSVHGDTLLISGDEAANSVELRTLEDGTTDVVPSDGTTLVFEGISSAGTINILIPQPKLVAKLKAGADALTVNGVFAALTIEGGADANLLALGSATVLGKTTYKGGANDDLVTVTGPRTTQKFLGDVSIDMGNGDNLFSGGNATPPVIAGKFIYTGGKGSDTLTLSWTDAVFAKDLLVNAGKGTFLMATGGTGLFEVMGKAKIAAQNQGSETATIVTANAARNVFAGGFDLTTGTGPETVVISGLELEIGGGFQAKTGAGSSLVTVTGAVTHIAGPLSINATGLANVTIAPSGQLTVDGAVTINSGAASTMTLAGTGSIAGQVSVGVSGGNATVVVRGLSAASLSLAHGLTVDCSVTNRSSVIALRDLVVEGPVRLTSGSAGDTISIDNLTTGAAASIVAGRGNDTVEIERQALDPLPSTFPGPFSIRLGGGDDSASFGGSDAALRMNISFGFKVDGGTGTDTLNLAANGNVLLHPPVLHSFELGS